MIIKKIGLRIAQSDFLIFSEECRAKSEEGPMAVKVKRQTSKIPLRSYLFALR